MEELGSMWNYQVGVDQLKFRLQITTMELESLKMEADEQKRKHSEEINHLLGLIKLAYKERDEAREQLKMLINKLMPHPRSENPVATSVKANSSITESNSLSDAYNHHHSLGCSSPGDSFFDAVTSPDFSTWKIAADSCKMMGFGNQHNVPLVTNIDSATAIIDDIAKGRSLPQKRKLLQAVMEAGPLLQTLIVAGPLPRWRNPPPFQAFKIPSVSLTGVCDSKTHDAKSLANPNRTMAQKRVNQCSASMMNFASSGLSSTRMLNKGAGFDSPINISQTTKGFYDLTKRR
ncbi:TOX high mobility group box family member 4-A [Hibiscus syriacus]|uniref:TOX high mobility group box family member 4-A n=1 Tax=Hibiscus syriacus TaxID=106335 RepID=A0A6A2YKK5_HIBSY|nr:uncharacterized protein LOC120162127 [Hibiscus syriacus]KAE8678927.1 TOX high mobility group box family member 4-A [Hibiscus syriacus]